MGDYYDRKGKPIGMMEWATAFERADRRIAVTALPGGGSVSTVYLGLDHQYGDGPPLIFETMVFGGPHDQDCERYSTEEEAKAGHEKMVAKCAAGKEGAEP